MVTRVIKEVKNQIGTFTTYDKQNDYKDDDLVTTADYEAQQLYTTMIGDVRSDAGIVAEEH
jgi:fructose-1,6-bisphosphatase/inositol monophosphatase family enzyme